ncbi:[Fe-Fe] hydrogenase large subunit C-terminal domain-containing protein [Cellulosilyticum sp. I15G10I2]|uniref:[Fe-Fe] hydrogenase large subunit C-terminal domain-containing protein n=1 Tax=Cellulosilyticum sp. I15G10I2 TaxID=1892843 RepID=UPI00085CD2D5|nr:[Fe-Fe] hydrogenase large subunit C-terminal domain-containing protein [Cellulosilyticum sp. I15G10I2]
MHSHSVTLEKDKCIGCTDCIKRCPTEAIRVRGSKAKIIEDRCIDCGNCIRICRNGAKRAVTDEISLIDKYKYRIALPAPSFYAQFPKAKNIEQILSTLYHIGFTDILEVGCAAEVIAKHTYDYVKTASTFPIISSSCPAIVRLIQRRFPSLIHHVLPIMSPMELAARYIKNKYIDEGISEDEIGVFFISPCPAKATDIHRPKGLVRSYVDGVLSMQDIYKMMIYKMNSNGQIAVKRQSTYKGLSWATRNGGLDEDTIKSRIAVDGMESVIGILEKVEDGTLADIKYIEALACTGGCLGGALAIENPFVSRYTLKKWIEEDAAKNVINNNEIINAITQVPASFSKEITPRPVFSLDKDMEKALKMMEDIESLYKELPQIDCGSCGAPTCRCFAEDVVKKDANIEECVFMLRKKIKNLSEVMHNLTETVIPTHNDK